MNVISHEHYKELEPLINENKVCLQCFRVFKKPIKTTRIERDRNSVNFGEPYTCCQKCINAINGAYF